MVADAVFVALLARVLAVCHGFSVVIGSRSVVSGHPSLCASSCAFDCGSRRQAKLCFAWDAGEGEGAGAGGWGSKCLSTLGSRQWSVYRTNGR